MANLTHALELAKSLLQENNLVDWRVTTTNKKRSFGTCNYTHKTVALSALITPHCTDDAVWNTITHEVAHALTYARTGERGHGYQWQRIHRELGGDAKRLGGADNFIGGKEGAMNAQAKLFAYVGICPNGHKHYAQRLPRVKHSCNTCAPFFSNDFLITYTKNTER